LTYFRFRSWNFYKKKKKAAFWSAWKELANCGPSHYADTSCGEV